MMENETAARREIDRQRELDWVDRVRAGDQTACAEIYGAYAARIESFVFKRIRNRAEAEDLMQETFLQLFRSFDAYDGRASLLTWTFGIARNVCSHYIRHSSRWMVGHWNARALVEHPDDPAIERRLDAARALARCDTVLSEQRPGAHRAIFQLRYAERQSLQSIADHVGKTRQAVKASLRLSRNLLVERLPELDVVRARVELDPSVLGRARTAIEARPLADGLGG